MKRSSGVRGVALVCLAVWVGGCSADVTASPAASTTSNRTGILVVNAGEQVQAAPPTEPLKVAYSQATALSLANGVDMGYPWFDQSSGELVLSAATPHGRELINAASIAVPHRIRDVTYGSTALEKIKHDVTLLQSQGVAGADVIVAAIPDSRDNRVLIVVTSMSDQLLDALAQRFPPDALAVQVNPGGLG